MRKSSATSDDESMAQTPTDRDAPAARTQAAALAELPDGDATDAEQPDCLPEDDEHGTSKVTKRASRAARTSKARSNGGQVR